MSDDHRYVDSLTDRVTEGLERLVSDDEPKTDTQRAARAEAAALASLVDDHFAHEEREIVPLFARHLTAG
jgi:hypothetical protein